MSPGHSMENATVRAAGEPGMVWTTLFVIVLALGIVLRLANHNVTNPTPDERTYESYAELAARGSIETPRLLVEGYSAHPENWVYPTPIRIGYYYLLAAAMKCTGANANQAGVGISSLFSIVQFLLVAVIGLRFLDRWAALIALALFSVCPMDLAIARRVWEDGVVGCVGLMLFYFCMEASWGRRRNLWLALYCISGFFFLLLKESTGLVFGFYCLLLIGMCRAGKCSLLQCAGIALGCVLTGLFAFVTMAVLSGGVPNLVAVLQHTKQTIPLNQYAINFQGGPWYSCPLTWWLLSPAPATLCFLSIACWLLPGQRLRRALAMDEAQCRVVWAMVLSIFFVTALTALPLYLKNLRYVCFIYGSAYLLGGLGLRYLAALCMAKASARARGWVLAAAAMLVAGAMVADFLTFERLFVKGGIDDLATGRIVGHVFTTGL